MKKVLMICAAAIAFAGCKGRSNNPISGGKAAANDKDLQGTFDGACKTTVLGFILTGAATDATIASQRIQYKIEADALTRKTSYFTKADCSEEAFIIEEIGSVENVRAQGDVNTGYTVDMVFNNANETPLTDAGVAAANGLKWCGQADWAKGAVKKVDQQQSAEKLCYGVAVPRRVYNRYRVDAGKLYLATDEMKAIRPEERPAKVDLASPNVFQKR